MEWISVKDHRCISMRDDPYSSYCKACWYPVYSLWADKEPHGGKCIHGCDNAANCQEANNRSANSAAMQKARAANKERIRNDS